VIAPEKIADELRRLFEVNGRDVASFREDGFARIKNVFSPELLEYFRERVGTAVARFSQPRAPIEKRSTYDKAFLQITNLWRRDEAVREFVMSERLGSIAAALLEVCGVRLYHDQALYKEPGGGFTPWHADQYYWPLASDRTITAWVPLQATQLEMGSLAFCKGSQRLAFGRDMEISDESEESLEAALAKYDANEAPFELGEVSFHGGWTFHRAGANRTNRMREVMTVIYMDEEMRLAAPRNKHQEIDRDAFCPGVAPGAPIATELNPVIYSSRGPR
jgi:ectoine hydroxylase-related dioxygenase (phytanoyl-CoA dioxygenase family)